MRKNKVQITKNLVSDLNDVLKNVKVNLATTFRDELTEETVKALETFYDDYTPRPGSVDADYTWKYYQPDGVPYRYNRHYTNFLKKSFKKYYKNPHNSVIKGGVTLSSSSMQNIYSVPTAIIFQAVYTGVHGLPGGKNKIPSMDPPPYQMIIIKKNEMIEKLGVYAMQAYTKAASKSYSTIKCNKGGVKIGR